MMPCNADLAAYSTAVSPFVMMDPMLTTTVFVTLAFSFVVQILMGLNRLSKGEMKKGEETFSKFLWGLSHQIGMMCIFMYATLCVL
mmetsp:Transcript_19745/g.20086  ORF Transcript_19745/g.20086 Transcript_19745/m.20086 type:complete len:86 (+) Transcript_19745:696-953(+)